MEIKLNFRYSFFFIWCVDPHNVNLKTTCLEYKPKAIKNCFCYSLETIIAVSKTESVICTKLLLNKTGVYDSWVGVSPDNNKYYNVTLITIEKNIFIFLLGIYLNSLIFNYHNRFPNCHKSTFRGFFYLHVFSLCSFFFW